MKAAFKEQLCGVEHDLNTRTEPLTQEALYSEFDSAAAKMLETLFIVGLDFIPAMVKVILLALGASVGDLFFHSVEIGFI